MTTSSVHTFTDPVRLFKANDPYYWELDNLPLKQLLENDRYLKEKLDNLGLQGGVSRSDISELKPYVTESDNIVRVKSGRFSARINDIYNKTPLQKIRLLQTVIGGDFHQFTNINAFAPSSFDEIVDKVHSDLAVDSLNMNGLAERVFQIRIANPDNHIDNILIGDLPSTGQNIEIDKWPVVFIQSFKKQFSQSLGTFSDLANLESEFIKMWRGPARIAIVDVPSEIEVEIPSFDENDFQQNDPITGAIIPIPNATTRIDLVFIYSHPVDTNSTSIFKFTGGVPQSITTPVLGVLKGAGAVLKKLLPNTNLAFSNPVEGAQDGNKNSQILGQVADQFNTNNGFQGLGIHGSFPSPDDLLNIAPNLIETMESDNIQLIGQSILPICYVVIRKGASTNTGGQPVILNSDIIDIRPFLRTAELTYSERAGLAAASPPISLANPVMGQFQAEYSMNQLKTRLSDQIIASQALTPRVVAGGTIWGGTKFGAEGSVRLAAKLLAGVADSNLPFQTSPVFPDWDLADWWTIFSPNVTDAGLKRNDRVNMYRLNDGATFDSGTDPTDPADISTAIRKMGTQYYSNTNAYTIHWCKKEILIDRDAVPWMSNYTVDCEFINCIPQSDRASRSGNSSHSDESGAAGIWVERKLDRFVIYVGWIADSPALFAQNNSLLHGREPKDDRDTYGFSGFFVRHSDMGLPNANNIGYNSLSSKAPHAGVCTYPTISFRVTGFPPGFYFDSLAQYPNVALLPLR